MRTLLVGLLLVAGALPAAAATPTPLDTFNRFVDDLNKGNVNAAAETYTASPTILDEMPPHHWTGPGAFHAWARDFTADMKRHAETDAMMQVGEPTYSVVEANSAYYVIPGHYTFKENGQAMTEDGSFAVAMTHASSGWKIASWAWAGATPK